MSAQPPKRAELSRRFSSAAHIPRHVAGGPLVKVGIQPTMPRPGECSDRAVFTRDVQYYLLLLARIALPIVDVHVTRLADHKGFAPSCRYEPFPRGF